MKALVLTGIQQPLEYQEVPTPSVLGKNVLVKIAAAALNHRDIWIGKGLYAGIKTPCILGSDGAGTLDGQKVVIYPAFDWGTLSAAQSGAFRVLGMPEDGTFAEFISVPKHHVFPMPSHLDFVQAAALPLAGLTAFRALFSRCKLKSGEKVLITGIGGGVALMALQLAVAVGAEVFVSSGDAEKIEKAVRLGAKGGANYRDEDWDKTLKKMSGGAGFSVVIDSAGGDPFNKILGLCRPGARVGIYGGTLGKVNGWSPQLVFWKQISILGSTMGSPAEFKKMLLFVEKHRIVPVVDAVFPLASGNEAIAHLTAGAQFGKVVLRV